MDPRKVEAVTSWPTPKTLKELQAFLGFANFYRRFIEGYSRITRGMTDLLKKDQIFKWGPIPDQSFERLKAAFLVPDFLAHFNPEIPAEVETDASDGTVGGAISQRQGTMRTLWPVAFYSRKMIPAEKNYDIYDKEMLAIVE